MISKTLILLTYLTTSCLSAKEEGGLCSKNIFLQYQKPPTCQTVETPVNDNVYILYDVNPVEGFNLRRDVYIRMAVFIRNLRKSKTSSNVKLVLPPFRRLYHWRSSHISQQNVFWNEFFDMNSLKGFTEVMDFFEFLKAVRPTLISGKLVLENVYKLTHFEDMFADGVFIDKYEHFACEKSDSHPGLYMQYENLTENKFSCLRFQGGAKLLEGVIKSSRRKSNISPLTVLFLNAEIVLHDFWGNYEFWQARRSMRFNKRLVQIAAEYREEHFNSTDEYDLVQRPPNWIDEKPYRGAKGGDYLCAHLRRADFLYGREKVLPTLKSAATQIKAKLNKLGLSKVFIASDCSVFEFKNLKSYLGRVRVYRFTPESIEQKADIKDGGIAIVDQIICSHAKFFVGTYESTFTYRIYEEREILGFPKEVTFNTLCKNEDMTNCERNSVWPIVY